MMSCSRHTGSLKLMIYICNKGRLRTILSEGLRNSQNNFRPCMRNLSFMKIRQNSLDWNQYASFSNFYRLSKLIKNNLMNHRVRKYTPLYLSPQPKPSLEGNKPTITPHWKSFLNKQVDAHYHRLKQQPNLPQSPIIPVKSMATLCSHLDSNLSGSEAKSNTSHWQLTTPKKQGQLKLNSYSSLSTVISSPFEREQQMGDSYRVKLLQEECNYLRRQFIAHCMRKHPKEFQP